MVVGRSPFDDWAAVVVAGDDHASHAGDLTETFDNARRDIVAAFERKGFAAARVKQFSRFARGGIPTPIR